MWPLIDDMTFEKTCDFLGVVRPQYDVNVIEVRHQAPKHDKKIVTCGFQPSTKCEHLAIAFDRVSTNFVFLFFFGQGQGAYTAAANYNTTKQKLSFY